MEILHTSTEIQTYVADCKKKGQTVGFVPTMGALHAGHLALVKQSCAECDQTIASIFVNPTQFNDKDDLKRYPRTPETDCQLLAQAGTSVVFMPTEKEIYPEPDTRVFNFGTLETVMEGAFRPGHFNGVAQVVSRLFDIVMPDKAYFGLKDFQQLAIIQAMVHQLNYSVQIVPCPIVREPDGLAMSSRNVLLNPVQRKNVPLIAATLTEAVKKAPATPLAEVKEWVTQTINANPELEVEYFDIVDNTTLQSVANWSNAQALTGCIAVRVGKIRLIDNVQFTAK